MAAKNLKIDQLKLDLFNPRIRKAADQHEAMQQIINDQGLKLANLADSIIDNNSLNPTERLIVLKDAIDGKYIVLEGNRRTLALKLLNNPAALTGLSVPNAFQKRFENLALRFSKNDFEPIACYEVGDRADAITWIQLRHRGEDEGRGIVSWSAEAIARFTNREPALQALDFVRQHADLTEEEKVLLLGKFPITNLDRLLSNPAVRDQIGFEVKDGKLWTSLPATEAIKPLKRIVLDLAQKKIVVTQLKVVPQQLDYISKIDPADMPDLSKKGSQTKAIETIDQSHFQNLTAKATTPTPSQPAQPATATTVSTARAQKHPQRLVIVPKACRLNVTNNNTLEIYKELGELKLKQFPNAIAVLLRVFMENSVDHYMGIHSLSQKFTRGSGGREQFKTLATKLSEVVAHLIAAGADRRDFDGVNRALSDPKHPLSIDLQHAYVHNRHVTPSERDLVLAWDNAQVFFEHIWK